MKNSTKILAAITLTGILLAGCAASASQMARISAAEAKAAAIAAAGVEDSRVRFSSIELERRNGIEYYEVDFVVDGTEYDFAIDALTGKVIGTETEQGKKKDNKPVSDTQAAADPTVEVQGATITEEEAKQIALSQVPGAKESHMVKFGIDYDDGKLEYEGTIIFEEMEYEFEIDGRSGAIRDWDAESIYD